MPIDVTHAGEYLFVRLYGTVTAADLLHYSQASETHEREAGHAMSRISDLTSVDRFDVSHRDVFEFADRRKREHQPGVARSAIIANEPIQIGLARMYQTLTENPNLEIRIVHSLADAHEWIGHAPETFVTNSAAAGQED
jgi:hypothetical protein